MIKTSPIKLRKLLIRSILLLPIVFLLQAAGCDYYQENKDYTRIDFVIGVSQANLLEAWRLVATNEIKEEAEKYPDISLIIMDATSDTEKQKRDINKLLDYGIDLLIVSPNDVDEMTPIIRDVYQKIPVIVMDRAVEGFDYTLYIGPDNELIGRQAGDNVMSLLKDKEGTILELCGSEDSKAEVDKSKGFESIVSEYPQMQIIQKRISSATRDDTEDFLFDNDEILKNIDIIFAHNDYMARGAYLALQEFGLNIPIIGIDGFTGENNGISMIQKGIIAETITCPTGGKEAIQFAVDILQEVSGVPKQIILRSHSITKENVEGYLAGLDKPLKEVTNIIDVGYSQLGTESEWRLANTASIKDAARDAGINLIFDDADQSQEKQVKAVEKFIEMKVDVIVISPVVDYGWDTVLKKAKAAGIPVILSDRRIEVEDDDLFETYIGADFMEEGRRAMRWVAANVIKDTDYINILELKGTVGASPSIERKKGFEEIMAANPQYRITYSEVGNFTYQGGKMIIEDYLKKHEWDIDVIFAHNDDMALGAMEALEKNGIKPGTDVKIVSVDGTRQAFEAMMEGKLNCSVECSPLLGPQLMKAVKDLVSGKELPLRIITEEKIYTEKDAKAVIKSRKY
ncbi:MAG: substrate-binding domain-containing protein [Mobilitalea sp.]